MQRPAQAGLTLKIATGHLYWLQTFVGRDGGVSKEPDGHRYVCFADSCTRGNAGCSTKTGVGGVKGKGWGRSYWNEARTERPLSG